jgi:putative resolvase
MNHVEIIHIYKKVLFSIFPIQMDSNKYISAKQIEKEFGIHKSTIRRWDESGLIACARMPGGKRLIPKNEIIKILGIKHTECETKQVKNIIYARVSSSHQKEDLERQVIMLKEAYPCHTLIKDVGSGLNWKRQGMRSLLEQVYQNDVKEVVVTDRDRLCRFGFDILAWIFEKHNVKLVVHCKANYNETGSALSSELELSQDILAVCNYFVAKNNGRRAHRNRKIREQKQEDVSDKKKERD